MSEPHLIYEVKDGVAEFRINREAQRNAISGEVLNLFLESLDRAEKDETVRVILVTGAGDRAFCAGADLGSGIGGSGGKGADSFLRYAGLLKRIAGCPKPTVARVNGSCVAGGMGLLLACDIAVTTSAAKFGTPEVNVGLFPMMIGALIFRNVTRRRAMEMVLLGEKMGADEAREMGLVTRVTAPEDLDREVDQVVDTLKSKSPIGIKIGKEAFYRMADMPFEKALDYLSGKLGEVAATEDAVEGITAFIEKRKPVFRGK
jgi:enoyl-CoA hydratase/carnithine racemase